ncbi:MAG TPA: ABC transporter permease [Actinomycetota bacterium]|nr:ABC transporter permease [Actinomycetota bacterium]
MIGFIVRRIGQAIIVLLGLTLLVFVMEHLLPGNIARAIIGPRATGPEIAAFNRANDLDRSVLYQYAHYLNQLIHGNLGFSYTLNRSVWNVLKAEVPRDLLLVGTSIALAVLIAVPVGVSQAVKRNGLVDYAATSVSFLLYSMPSFALGLILIQVFAIQFAILPPEAPQSAGVLGLLAHPSGFVLPVATLTLSVYALFSRYMRSSAIDALAQDYIRTARAKGLPEHLVLWRHLVRNSLVPIATLVGLSLPAVFTFGLVVEQLFNFPGVGLQYFTSATQTDYPTMLGITLLVGVATVAGSLLADLAYAALDPRVRFS